jgi:hypothetical protein
MPSTRNGRTALGTRSMNSVVLDEGSPRYRYIITLFCISLVAEWLRSFWVPWVGSASLSWFDVCSKAAT